MKAMSMLRRHAVGFGIGLLCASVVAQAQEQRSGPPPGAPGLPPGQQGPIIPANMTPGPLPRTAEGKPDLSGIWSVNFDLNAYFPVSTLAETEPVGFTGGMPSYKPEALAKVKKLTSKDDPVLHCKPWGILRQPGLPMPTQLVQTPKQLVVLYEYFNSFRVIPSDGSGHREDMVPTFMGDSVGHWEGDTFVVDGVGFNDETWIGEPGTFHTDKMHVVERYTLINKDTLLWEATVTDPEVLAQPWKLKMPWTRAKPGTRLFESICTDTATSQHVRDEPKKPGAKK